MSGTDPILERFGMLPGKPTGLHQAIVRKEADEARWDHKPIMKMHRGVETEFFAIGHLSAALQRRPVTIRSWEDKGVLPVARFRHKGRRLYTRAQIEVVLAAAAASGLMPVPRTPTERARVDWPGFRKRILEGWKALQ